MIVLLAKIEHIAYRAFVPDARIVVIPNALNVPRIYDHDLDKAKDHFDLIYVGRLIENKGLVTALEALRMLVTSGLRVKLTIAGDGPQHSRLRSVALHLGLAQHVHFVGPLFADDKAALWRKGHVFILPTEREGMPYALLEALAAGAVPITTRVGAIPDVVEEEVHGLFVPPRDPAALASAVRRLYEDRVLLKRMARAGRERVATHYHIDRFSADFNGLYEHLALSR